MKRGHGKNKGNAFERSVCKELSLWLTKGKRDDVLWRSAISGGRATVHAKKGRNLSHVAGDICAVAEEGRVLLDVALVECKSYRDLNTSRLLFDGSGGKLHEFWLSTVAMARSYNKLAILIAKQNLFQPVVVLESDVLTAFGLRPHVFIQEGDANVVPFAHFVEHAPVAALARWRGRRQWKATP